MENFSPDSEDFEAAAHMIHSLGIHVDTTPTLQEVLGVASHDAQRYYEAACRLLQKKRYSEAADAFFFLTMLDPTSFCYWLNLGLAEQMQERYVEALDSLGMATLLNMDDPTPHVYAAECYIASNKLSQAIDSLRLAMECPTEGDEFASVKCQMIDLTKLIKKARNTKRKQ